MPITLVLSLIALKLHLIRSNELVAFYALGYSKRHILRPLFATGVGLSVAYLLLHLTSFTYADEYAKNIKKYQTISSSTKNLFFRYNDTYVFFERLFPLQKRAEGVRLFDTKNRIVERIIIAKEARFSNNAWHIEDALVIKNLGDRMEKSKKDLKVLEGFKPKILDSVYEGKTNISLPDAFYAMKLLQKQQLKTAKLRAIIYAQLFFPFFAPLLMVVIFYFVPLTARLANLNLFTFGAILASLLFWGSYYLLVKLAFNEALSPEAAILAPLALLAAVALYFYKKF
jgi:lipopolysaccharide export system permease protein